jgi:hypothetical protein
MRDEPNQNLLRFCDRVQRLLLGRVIEHPAEVRAVMELANTMLAACRPDKSIEEDGYKLEQRLIDAQNKAFFYRSIEADKELKP